MKYTVTVSGREIVVDVRGVVIEMGGGALPAALEHVPGSPLQRLVLDGRGYEVAVSRDEGGWTVEIGGRRWSVSVEDERTRRLATITRERHIRGGGTVVAPMPGMVVLVEVAVGQSVEAGAGLVILEAMKMENEIRARAPGVVRAVHVQPGQAVEKGAPLLELAAG